MLTLAFRSYSTALRLETQKNCGGGGGGPKEGEGEGPGTPTSQTPSPPAEAENDQQKESKLPTVVADEEWLYNYMLTKCEEKAGPGGLMRDRTNGDKPQGKHKTRGRGEGGL